MDYSRPFLLPLLTVVMMLFSNRLAVEFYKFYEGRDVVINFTQPMSNDSTFQYELYSIQSQCGFCKNGTLVPGCLPPQQFSRFSVHSVRSPTDLKVTLSIDMIDSEDSQIYLFALREDKNGESMVFTQDVHIEVLHPPSPAECTVKPSEYSAAWNEVNCTSLLGSDGEGSLYCFQDGKKAPYKESPVRITDHVTQIFWMKVHLPITCCSYEETFPLTSASCSQFVYSIPTHTTVSDNSKNPPSSLKTPGTTVQQTNAQITSSSPSLDTFKTLLKTQEVNIS
ncbi:uncharacterized protein [Diadema setosum]|uniref:uncharacterized protein n=1 Tax=Diadema setosum TaxID=31175 RepID=UPI003B3BAF85